MLQVQITMVVLTILISFLSFAFSYNIDTDYPLIFSDPSKNNSQIENSYYGFSVLLLSKYNNFESELIVGAPKGNFSEIRKSVKEPGIIYRCTLQGKCHPVSPTSHSTSDIAVNQIGMYAKIIQDKGWFGMSIATIHPNLMKICAPRTRVDLFKAFKNEYSETMQGMCYFYSRSTDGSFLQIETDSLTTYNFSTAHWYNPQYGFSQNVATGISSKVKLNIQDNSESIIKSLLQNVSLIVGNPTNQISGSIDIIKSNKRKTLVISDNEKRQEEHGLGYAVSSGRYFKRNETVFASGAPSWDFIGKVLIVNSISSDVVVMTYLHGHQLGEYFGASLASGDLNNDGFDELIVGAPHYNEDNGKVYIYLGNEGTFLDFNPVLEGSIRKAQFGFSLMCGDLDLDGFSDLIVGAPWEDSGAIYIYNGFALLGAENNLKVSQKITAAEISSNFQGFGFSISNFADVDDNGFLDVAVGVYRSGHAVILRSKPVEKLQINLTNQPTTLSKKKSKISPEFCLKNFENHNQQIVKNYNFTITVDPRYRRFNYNYIIWHIPLTRDSSQVFQYQYSSQKKWSIVSNDHWNKCTTSHFFTKVDIHNFIDPVDIVLSYTLESYELKSSKHQEKNLDNFCKYCPIKYMGRDFKELKLSIPYEIDCGKDKICTSDISVTTSVHGVGKNNSWEIGSGDISLEVKFQNHGEPAYLVTANFLIPKEIHLRSILSFCQEEISENLIVMCNVANPLEKGAQKIIKLDFDMRSFETRDLSYLKERNLLINLTVKSQSNDQGIKQISIPLHLQNNVSASISGKTNNDSYYLKSAEEKIANITFQHVYNIFKFGATPITEGKLIIEIPTKLDDVDEFMLLRKPQFQILGVFHNCDISEISQKSLVEAVPNNAFENNNSINNSKIKSMNGSYFQKKNNENHFIFMNCLNSRIQCRTITCDLSSLKSSHDIGKVILNLTIRLEVLKKIFNVGTALHLTTRAQINIEKPLTYIMEEEVSTTFYNLEGNVTERLTSWIIVISVIIGLIILSIITAVLYHIGFFRKKQKLKLNLLNINEKDEDQDHNFTEKINERDIFENSLKEDESSSSSG